MSISYNYNLKWVDRDDLTAGDPDKKIIAQDFEDEWIKIQTAFASAAPAASPTFTGTVTTGNLTASGTVSLNGLTYPATDGTNGQALITNGSGSLSWGSRGVDGVSSTAAPGSLQVAINNSGIGVYNGFTVVSADSHLQGDLDVDGEVRAGFNSGFVGYFQTTGPNTQSYDVHLKTQDPAGIGNGSGAVTITTGSVNESSVTTSGDVVVTTGGNTGANASAGYTGDVRLYTTVPTNASVPIAGTVRIQDEGSSGVQVWQNGTLVAQGEVRFTNLPTSNPGGTGRVWNDGGTLKIT